MIRRAGQFLLIATLLPLCWLSMMAVHEGGPFLCALITKGHVTSEFILCQASACSFVLQSLPYHSC